MPKHGVISSLRRKKPGERGYEHTVKLRKQLKEDLRLARRLHNPNNESYGQLGTNYRRLRLMFKAHFEEFLARKKRQVREERTHNSNAKLRWLDIGPGLPENFLSDFDKIDPSRLLVEFHTLGPQAVNPKRKPEMRMREIKLSEGRTEQIRRHELNPDYNPLFTHHVGAIETYDPRKLGGKFDCIVSTGTLFYGKQITEVLPKICDLLNHQGRAFLQVGFDVPALIEFLRTNLPVNYELRQFNKTFLMIERVH
ncbi:MAG: hypothetical protein Q7S92_06925 [Candidatus Diapherotrites archaeon]|nr:hypothetical protein [Candidatus Diapherotrites archaeon]